MAARRGGDRGRNIPVHKCCYGIITATDKLFAK